MTAEHTDNNNSIFKIALNLTCACIISGIIIAVVYFFTADIAAQAKIEIQNQALQSLVAEADQYTPIDGKTGWYTATQNGKLIAYVVPAESKGYGGTIKLLVAVGPDNKVMKYTILDAKETPGLGDKAADAPFADQFAGKESKNLVVTKDASNKDDIQAISGATITSKAVTLAVKNAVDEVSNLTKGGK
jgi:electron transport complex protein RnfG